MHKSEENLSKQKKITEVDLQRELDRRTPTELTFVALLVGLGWITETMLN